jgi:hypothetical protein
MMIRPCLFLGALALAAACGGGDDDGGGGAGGTVTASGTLDGEPFEFAETCVASERESAYSVYASAGDDEPALEVLWRKTSIDAPGTYTIDLLAGISFYATLGPAIEDTESAEGTVTFETYAPEDGVLSGTFDVTVDDPPFEASGAFDCM